MNSKLELHISQKDPLSPFDTLEQTYGCRAYNPFICKFCDTDSICAFVTKDKICRQPPKTWKKIFIKLSEGENNE